MGKCKQHPECDVPGEGVCPACLQEKLDSVLRGEETTSHSDVAAERIAATRHPIVDPIHLTEAITVLGSIASITKRKHSKQNTGVATRPCNGGGIMEASLGIVLDSRYADGGAMPYRIQNPGSQQYASGDARDGCGRGDAGADLPGPRASPSKHPHNIEGIMKDWAELHGRRRSKLAAFVENPTSLMDAGKSPFGSEFKPPGLESKPGLSSFAGGRSVGSMPLVDRIAKETALRVIREVGEEPAFEGLEEFSSLANQYQLEEDNSGEDDILLENRLKLQEKVTCFIPVHWHSRIRSKWVKGLGNSMSSSNNKVFPSKSVENVQKSQAHVSSPARDDSRIKTARDVKNSVDWRKGYQQAMPPQPSESEFSDMVIEGMPDQILKPEDMNQRSRTSYDTVLSWLQDLPSPQTPLFQKTGQPEDLSCPASFAMESRNNDFYVEDLTLVGNLHEIAEKNENLEESSVEEELTPKLNYVGDVASFGEFLIRAAQRHPKQGLSRVDSSTPAR